MVIPKPENAEQYARQHQHIFHFSQQEDVLKNVHGDTLLMIVLALENVSQVLHYVLVDMVILI